MNYFLAGFLIGFAFSTLLIRLSQHIVRRAERREARRFEAAKTAVRTEIWEKEKRHGQAR